MPQLQIINKSPGFGEELGSALGMGASQGIAGALSQMLEKKEQQKQNLQRAEALKSQGIEVPAGFFSLPDQLQKTIIQDKLFQNFFSQPQSNTFSNLEIDSQNQVESFPEKIESKGFSSLSDDQLVAATANPMFGKAAKAELDRRTALQKDVRKSEIGRSTKFLENVEDSRSALLRSKTSLSSMENALNQRNLGFFSPDNLGKIPGFSAFVTPEGAVFNAASKEFFLSDMERVMGRPNQFLEKVLSGAIPKIGISNEANREMLEFYKNALDLQEEKIRISDQLEDYYREKLGYVPGNIGRLVDRQLKPYAEKKEKELITKFKSEKSTGKSQKSGNSNQLNVYDGHGKLVGSIHKSQIDELPEGFVAK